MNRYLLIPALLGAALLASCDLSGSAVQDITAPAASARIKFHNFSPSAGGVNFFGNGTKLTAVASSACQAPATGADSTACTTTGLESTIGTKYGQVASGGLYDAVSPGDYTFTADLAGTSTVVSTATQTIADGKYYSFFMSGPYDAGSNTAESFVVEDPIPTTVEDTVVYVRFVNAVSNATDALTLYVTNTETKEVSAIGSAVPYKSAGAFETLTPGTYTLSARYPGSSTNVITRSSAVTMGGGHVYTVTGYGTTVGSKLALDFTQNQR
jgi:hypothetical protein